MKDMIMSDLVIGKEKTDRMIKDKTIQEIMTIMRIVVIFDTEAQEMIMTRDVKEIMIILIIAMNSRKKIQEMIIMTRRIKEGMITVHAIKKIILTNLVMVISKEINKDVFMMVKFCH